MLLGLWDDAPPETTLGPPTVSDNILEQGGYESKLLILASEVILSIYFVYLVLVLSQMVIGEHQIRPSIYISTCVH